MNKPTRFYSKKQETEVAKKLDGKVVSNSGATKFNKGDVTTNHFLVECKTKTKNYNSFSIQKEWLEKAREEAFGMGKLRSALVFDFGPDTERFYVIDERTFQEFNRLLDD